MGGGAEGGKIKKLFWWWQPEGYWLCNYVVALIGLGFIILGHRREFLSDLKNSSTIYSIQNLYNS